MSSVDNRVVKMSFDNEQFKKGAAETKQSLDSVNTSVDKAGKGKGLLDMSRAMDTVRLKASTMQIAAVTAISTITNKAVNAGLSMVKSLTFDPIREGFLEYESLLTKQNVIMNATGKSAEVVKARLNELNAYSDKTIYSFSNMTDAVQSFVNAGVPLGKAVTAIKGVGNAAAYSGANSEEASRAMRAFGQAMGTGFLGLQDFMQLENANMGTIEFKKQLIEQGVAMGTLTKKGNEYITNAGHAVSATKGWREGLKDQWATTEVLTGALSKYTDENTKLGKKAAESATQVRTFTAFMDTFKESLGSGWSAIFTALVGDLDSATSMWTGLSQAVGGVVGKFFAFGTTALTTWRSLGGFEKTLEGFKNLLSPIGALFKAVGDAWKAAFPSSDKGAGKALYGISAGFAAITSPLRLFASLISGLTPVLTVFFQVFKIAGVVIGDLIGFVVDLVSKLSIFGKIKGPSSGGILDWIKKVGAAIGDAIGQISTFIDKGKSLKDAFGSVDVKFPKLPGMPDIGGLFGGGEEKASAGADKASAGIQGLTKNVLKLNETSQATAQNAFFTTKGAVGSKFDMVSDSVKGATASVGEGGKNVETVGDKIGGVLDKLKQGIGKFFEHFSFEDLMAAFNLAVLSTFMISLSRFFNTLTQSFEGFVGVGDSVLGVLDGAGSALNSFQTQANAKLILNIGIALLLLAGALFILSKIPADKLVFGLGAIGALMFIMTKAMGSMSKSIEAMDRKGSNLKMLALGVSMILFAIAVSILAGALKKFNDVDFDAVIKGGLAINILTVAMEIIAKIDKEGILQAGAAMVLVSIALLIFAKAIENFAKLGFTEFAEGMLYATAALLALRLTLNGFQTSLAGAAALIVVMGALTLLVGVIKLFTLLKWGQFVKGMAMVGISLLVLTAALQGFTSTLAGAAALVVAVVALRMLVGVIDLFAKLDWGTFGKGLLMMSIAFVTLGALMALMGVFSPLILAGALALLLFGAAMFLLGAGIMFLAKGIIALIAIGAGISAFFVSLAVGFGVFMQTLAMEAPLIKDSFLKILQSLVDTIVEAVPMIIDGIKRLFAAVKKEFTSDDKKKTTGEAGKSWIEKLKEGIIEKIPAVVKAGAEILVKFLKALGSKAKDIATAAADLIVKLVNGLGNSAGKLTNAAVDLIIKLANGLEKNAFKMVNAGIALIATFLHDLASAIRNGSAAIGGGLTDVIDAMKDVGTNMVKGLIKGITDMAKDGVGAIGNLAKSMIGEALDKFKIFSPSKVFYSIGSFLVMGLTNGIQTNAASAITAVASMVGGQIAVANEYVSGFIQQLDQQALAARAKADGLAAAAQKAAKAAKMTKNKNDDRAAENLQKQADAAERQAVAAENRAEGAKTRQDKQLEYNQASTLEKAKLRSQDAQDELDAAKAAEQRAATARTQAAALERQARAKGVSPKERRQLLAQADALRKQAAADAKSANAHLAAARTAASDSLKLQKQAGDEAAALFQSSFEAEAKAAADAAEFEKLSDADKAIQKRKEAAEMQAKADADLEAAKKLAYTDLEAANALAGVANDEAAKARQLLQDAVGFETSSASGSGSGSSGGALGSVVNLDPTDAAAIAMSDYAALYDAATAAAAGDKTVQFNQYNTSPESLSPTEVYRQTNNLFTHAVDKLSDAA